MTDATEQVSDRETEKGELNEVNESLIKHLTIISLRPSSDPSQCLRCVWLINRHETGVIVRQTDL